VNGFDDLIGADVAGEERARLLEVHELLVEAGPPPELSEGLRNVPRPGDVRFLPRRSGARKVALLAAAIVVLGATFSGGFAAGNGSSAPAAAIEQVKLSGTAAAPQARATLDLRPSVGGNWPMTLRVSGLPRVAAPTYYIVWLVRNGKTLAPCGQFVVAQSGSPLTLDLTAPYALKHGDTWIVTRQRYTQGSVLPRRGYHPHGMSSVVLRPATAA
jgi:hypothetical protein